MTHQSSPRGNSARTIGLRRIRQATATITGLGVAVTAAAIGLSTIPDDETAATSASVTSTTSVQQTTTGTSEDQQTTTGTSEDQQAAAQQGLIAGQGAPVARTSGS